MKQGFSLWISHSKINDFIRCPRLYYLKNVYKDPKTGRKINIVNPALALGNSVHEVFELLLTKKIPAAARINEPLLQYFNTSWEKFSGQAGGFKTMEEENIFKARGENMIKRVLENPGPIGKKALQLHSINDFPPNFVLLPLEGITLCGKVDWLSYDEIDDSIHIIDFKTGSREEDPNSLQLPIYYLLVKNLQKRNVKTISYWYLEKDNAPLTQKMPDLELAQKAILNVALQIKQAHMRGEFACTKNGCFACRPLENVLQGKARFIRASGYQDIYAMI